MSQRQSDSHTATHAGQGATVTRNYEATGTFTDLPVYWPVNTLFFMSVYSQYHSNQTCSIHGDTVPVGTVSMAPSCIAC